MLLLVGVNNSYCEMRCRSDSVGNGMILESRASSGVQRVVNGCG
jgi:hypothetical protein